MWLLMIIMFITGVIAWGWINGLDYMNKNHPNYKGDDLFGEFDEDDKNQIV